MLTVHLPGKQAHGGATGLTPGTKVPDGAWIDLMTPDEAETALVGQATGFAIPTFEQVSEVESSSRLRTQGDAIYLSMPVVHDTSGGARATPVGLILNAAYLVTVRFESLKAFETCGERVNKGEVARPSSSAVFAALCEAVVDRLADNLEEIGAELDELSEGVFLPNGGTTTRDKKAADLRLRVTLRRVGHYRQLISKVRATLLGIGRIVPFVEGEAGDWLPSDVRSRLDTLKADVASLDEYETHLSDKIQFLLDAALGFINIEQNDTFRVLTIVSVVGIPPTLIASMYGMNFKTMPELNWAYGYPYGLALIAASAIVPLVYFKRKGWF